MVQVAGNEDAYSIWLQTRSAVTSARYPRRIDYTIAVTGSDGSKPSNDHFRASCDPDDGAIRLFPISDEQLAQPPPVPRGVDVSFNIGICFGLCAAIRIPVGHPPPVQDLFGEPLLEPTYMFGIRYRPAGRSPMLLRGSSSLRTIAIVSTQAPDYRVALIDTPAIDGMPTYHLGLSPVRNPKANRLRQLWVGANDYLPKKAVIAGNFTLAPLVDVPWTVDFSIINGAPFVTRESTADPLYLAHRRVVRDAVIAFNDIREPSGSLYDRPLIEPAPTDAALVEPGP
jgi:hypothetical protein